ncbi:MAG: formate dehydrogenase accessory sulfurtransferase FdhD [Gemmataceae bacterium]|nr:formate dehydrogenase accessory sulfurtransferase FdhD [Gemmataceae bacterium]
MPDRARVDRVAVEAPLEVRIGGKPVTVLMRTPGDDEELVRGFLFNEGITHANDITAIGRPAELDDAERGNVIVVELTATRKPAAKNAASDRLFYSSSSCGVCGKKTIAALAVQGAVCESPLRVSRQVLAGLPDRLKAAQPTFALTGGVHASGLFTAAGTLVAVREDVGRHNALDKVIGWALAAGSIPLGDHLLLVSGRVSYEIVQKAIVAGLPLIAAIGAPSSLAVELAQNFKITLVGFLRPSAMNVYANPERVME